MQIGAEVVYSSLADIHVSGHACQEEQKLMLALTRPNILYLFMVNLDNSLLMKRQQKKWESTLKIFLK